MKSTTNLWESTFTMPLKSPSLRLAFTITELLVVILTLAVLLGLLLSGLETTRELTRKTLCQSNMRQLGATFTAYGMDHRGRLPLFMPSDKLQENYYIDTIVSGKGLQLMALGIIATENELPPKVLFCPSNTFINYTLNSPKNIASNPFYPITALLRSGYATCWTVTWGTPAPTTLSLMRSDMALLTDVCDIKEIMAFQHKKGSNVAYGDGHVQWVPWASIDSAYQGIPSRYQLSENNDAMKAYYTALGDQAH